MKCPYCNSENTQTYEAIFNKEYRTYNSKHNNSYGTIYTKGQSISPLGQKVFPPVKKKIDIYRLIVIALGSLVLVKTSDFFGIIKNFILYKQFHLFAVPYIFWLLLSVILIFISIRRFIYNKSTYPNLYKSWQSHWYCHKCSQGFSNIK